MARRTKGSGHGGKSEARNPRRRCPICGKPAAAKFRPFCSKRCADVDLNRWLAGTYKIPICCEAAIEDSEDCEAAGREEGSSGP